MKWYSVIACLSLVAFVSCTMPGTEEEPLITKPAATAATAHVSDEITSNSVEQTPEAKKKETELKDIRAVIKTNRGDIQVLLLASKTPVTVANFLFLADKGYYNNVTFHRVIPNFMIQSGDPTGTGTGGPGYQFQDEFLSSLRHDRAGILSMANPGRPNTNGSQFFITHGPTPHLDGKHTVFGVVTSGLPTVNQVQKGDVIKSIDALDSTDALFEAEKSYIQRWSSSLSR